MAEKTKAERVKALNWLTLLPLIFQVIQAIFGIFGKLPSGVQTRAVKYAVGFDWSGINWQKIFDVLLKIFEMFSPKNGDEDGDDKKEWPKTP